MGLTANAMMSVINGHNEEYPGLVGIWSGVDCGLTAPRRALKVPTRGRQTVSIGRTLQLSTRLFGGPTLKLQSPLVGSGVLAWDGKWDLSRSFLAKCFRPVNDQRGALFFLWIRLKSGVNPVFPPELRTDCVGVCTNRVLTQSCIAEINTSHKRGRLYVVTQNKTPTHYLLDPGATKTAAQSTIWKPHARPPSKARVQLLIFQTKL